MANFEERFERFTYKTKPVGAKNEAKFFKSEATPNRVKSFIKSELNNLLDRVLGLCDDYYNDKFNESWTQEQRIEREKEFLDDVKKIRKSI